MPTLRIRFGIWTVMWYGNNIIGMVRHKHGNVWGKAFTASRDEVLLN